MVPMEFLIENEITLIKEGYMLEGYTVDEMKKQLISLELTQEAILNRARSSALQT